MGDYIESIRHEIIMIESVNGYNSKVLQMLHRKRRRSASHVDSKNFVLVMGSNSHLCCRVAVGGNPKWQLAPCVLKAYVSQAAILSGSKIGSHKLLIFHHWILYMFHSLIGWFVW